MEELKTRFDELHLQLLRNHYNIHNEAIKQCQSNYLIFIIYWLIICNIFLNKIIYTHNWYI